MKSVVKKNKIAPIADKAHMLFNELIESKKRVGSEFLKLGSIFTEIKNEKLYKALGFDTFEEFIATPELGFARPTVYLFMRVFDLFIVKLKQEPDRIANCDISKLQLITPILAEGGNPDEWIGKVESLSRSDLRDEIKQANGEIIEADYVDAEEPEKVTLSELARLRPAPWPVWIKSLPCCVCGAQEVDAHHFPKTKGSGADDWKTIPLCRKCHTEYHQRPKEFLWMWRERLFDFFYEVCIASYDSCNWPEGYDEEKEATQFEKAARELD